MIGIDMGKDEEGKRKRKWYTFHGSKKEAEKERTRLLGELDNNTYVEPSKMTVAQYLNQWLIDVARPKTQNKTFERYSEIAKNHLSPALGHHLLQKLHPMHIQGYYASALRGGRRNGDRGGLSTQTVMHHHRVLSSALKAAVKLQLLNRNPCDMVEPPKVEHPEMIVLDEEQVARLLELLRGTQVYMPTLLAVTTGMRRGEILGIRWKDVNLGAEPSITIRQSLEVTKEGLKFKAPKTKGSRRTISIDRFVVAELKAHKARQNELRLLQPNDWQANDLVCCRSTGAPMHPNIDISKMFDRLWRERTKNGKPVPPRAKDVPRIRFHDLRHTHASLLIKQGEQAKTISQRLGHSSIGITMDTYGHLLPGVERNAVQKFEANLEHAIRRHSQ